MANEFPLPPMIPVPAEVRFEDVEDAALELYQRVADADRRVEEAERRLRAEMLEQKKRLDRVMAMLAGERFEFERLLRRLRTELDRRNAADVMPLLELYARAWDLKLSRAAVEVVDLTGHPLSDELVETVEVESHVPDPSVSQTIVRETLIPLVLLDGKAIGSAKIVTSVPVMTEETPQ